MLSSPSKLLLSTFRSGNLASLMKMSGQVTDVEQLDVLHDEDNKEFYIKLGDHKAYLEYDTLDRQGKKVDLQHTVVPEAFRGRGVGKVLAKAAFDHFVGKNQQMKLTCWYLKKFYQDNTEQYQGQVIS